MAAALPYIAAGGSILSAAGSMKAGSAAAAAGRATKQADIYQADQLDQNAGQAIASAQREAELQRRQTAMLVSRGIAVAAGSGGGVTDPTVSGLLEKIAAEGTYLASVDLYQGEERARLMRAQAQAKRYEGDMAEIGGQQKEEAANLQGFGAMLQGGSLFAKYGKGGPQEFTAGGWGDNFSGQLE